MACFGVRATGDNVCRERRLDMITNCVVVPSAHWDSFGLNAPWFKALYEAELELARLSASLTSTLVDVTGKSLRCNDSVDCMLDFR